MEQEHDNAAVIWSHDGVHLKRHSSGDLLIETGAGAGSLAIISGLWLGALLMVSVLRFAGVFEFSWWYFSGAVLVSFLILTMLAQTKYFSWVESVIIRFRPHPEIDNGNSDPENILQIIAVLRESDPPSYDEPQYRVLLQIESSVPPAVTSSAGELQPPDFISRKVVLESYDEGKAREFAKILEEQLFKYK